jgi:hypothetical protein
MEKFVDISNTEGRYKVSNLGNVISCKNGKERLLKIWKNELGYSMINFIQNGKKKNLRVHRLVAEAFLPRVEHKNEVNHIDGNKDNNNVKNLQWVTRKENMRHAFDNGLKVMPSREKHPMSKLKEKDIKKIRQLYNQGKKQIELSKIYNVTQANISAIVTNKTW